MMRALVLCLSLLGATVAAASEPDWRTWAEEAQKQHALAGRVYDVAPGKLSTCGKLPGSDRRHPRAVLLPPEGIVLLGEVHDNPASIIACGAG